jgi:hypothetical protein
VEEYISRITRLDQNTLVNDENVNAIVQQLQHNIDLLFNQWKSSHVTWNVSELLFGNIMDFDATGQKRFNNGGRMDSVEKVLTFTPYAGSLRYEETTRLNNDHWMTWDIPEFQQDNLRISRNIAIPQAIRHQNILIAFKFAPFSGSNVVSDERFDIYVNGVHSGAFTSGRNSIDGVNEAKTGYAVYNLTGTESNILVEFVRSPTNEATTADYSVRISDVFCGIHSLGNSQYVLNYPGCGSSFIGKNADINSFYDFKNNSVRPIPSFLIGNEHLTGESALTVNVTNTPAAGQSTYWVGLNGSGNETGVDSDNRMPFDTFNDIDTFEANKIVVDFEFSQSYGDLVFKSANYDVTLHGNTKFDKIKFKDNAYVKMTTSGDSDQLVFGDVIGMNNSRLEFENGDNDKKVRVKVNDIDIDDYSALSIVCGTFGMPLNADGVVSVTDHSNVSITLNLSNVVNADGLNGFGFSIAPMKIKKFSNVALINNNVNGLVCMITRSTTTSKAVYVQRHSHLRIGENFSIVSTVADDQDFDAELHSDIEVESTIQTDGGSTSFESVNASVYSTFGAVTGYQSLVLTSEQSYIYTIT